MPKFGQVSMRKLETAHPDLQRLFLEVVKYFDCTVLEGYRNKMAQDKAVAEGRSQTPYPTSKHNRMPSMAVDVAPFPVDWADTKRFYFFAGVVKGIALQMNIPIRWGGDWDGDTETKDNSFMDLPHYELKLGG